MKQTQFHYNLRRCHSFKGFGFILLVHLLFSGAPHHARAAMQALELPQNVRVESSKPRGVVWERLTARQKKLVYYLYQAGKAGRVFLFYQNHRHAVNLRDAFSDALSKKNLDKTKKLLGKEGFLEFVIYAAKFMDQSGPYSSSNRKYVLKKVAPDKVAALLARHSKAPSSDQREMVLLLTDPQYEVCLFPESHDGAGLEQCGGNLYAKGITGKAVMKAIEDGKLAPGLNCRVVETGGALRCETQTTQTPGLVGETLREIVKHLTLAKSVACTQHQRRELEKLIRFFETGEVEDFRDANKEWVRDRSESTVDTMMGWVEVYSDWLARIGSWETYIQIVDPTISKIAQSLAEHAQYFENAMPYGQFRKTFPKGYSPPAIMVYYFQEIGSYRTSGYNLPNFDDIRRDVGAKNVIRLPMPKEDKDPQLQAIWKEMFQAFFPKDKVEPLLKERLKIYEKLVLLHEIIGHGSGTYDEAKYGKGVDPISALGALGSALEEERADLTALVFVGDKTLVETGLYPSESDAKRMQKLLYDFYVGDFLRRVSGQQSLTESHQRGHWLLINLLLQGKAIEWKNRASGSGKVASPPDPEDQVLFVSDYELFWKICNDLLGKLQLIKATKDIDGLRRLFDQFAPLGAIDEPWAQAIIRRGKNLRINWGYVEQPWLLRSAGKSAPQYATQGGTTLESIAPYFGEFYR